MELIIDESRWWWWEHNCTMLEMNLNHAMDWLEANQSCKQKEIVADFQREYCVKISYTKAFKAKERAMKRILWSWEGFYNDLIDYINDLQKINPSTRTWMRCCPDKVSLRYSWCLGASIQSFKQSLQPLVVVDATYFREKYPGVLIITVTQYAAKRYFSLHFSLMNVRIMTCGHGSLLVSINL